MCFTISITHFNILGKRTRFSNDLDFVSITQSPEPPAVPDPEEIMQQQLESPEDEIKELPKTPPNTLKRTKRQEIPFKRMDGSIHRAKIGNIIYIIITPNLLYII